MSDKQKFKLEDGKFIRLSDSKEVANLGENGRIENLHHKREQYREELEALALRAGELTPNKKPEMEVSPEPSGGDAPRELFKKTLGDVTPEVIEWRRKHWPAKRFSEKYKGRNI